MTQGMLGERALGMLRGAYRTLTGALMERLAEVAAARVRSAADALLSMPGSPTASGMKSAGEGLAGRG